MLAGARKLTNLLRLNRTEAETPCRLIVDENMIATLSMEDVADCIFPAASIALLIGTPRTEGQNSDIGITESRFAIMNISLYLRLNGRLKLIVRLKVELTQSEKEKSKKTFIPCPPHETV